MTVMDNLRVGDVVHVRMTIRDVHGAKSFGADPQYGRITWIASNDIVHIEPRPFAVGDRVTVKITGKTGTIKAVADDTAWVLLDGTKRPMTEWLADLERVS